MTSKKIFGYAFIILAIFLTLAIVSLLPELLSAGFKLLGFFTGKLNIAEAGHAFGFIIFWVIHVSATAALWIYGRKWTKRSKKTIQKSGESHL